MLVSIDDNSVDGLIQGQVGVASQSGALQTAMFVSAFDSGIGSHQRLHLNQADLELSDGLSTLWILIRRPFCSTLRG